MIGLLASEMEENFPTPKKNAREKIPKIKLPHFLGQDGFTIDSAFQLPTPQTEAGYRFCGKQSWNDLVRRG